MATTKGNYLLRDQILLSESFKKECPNKDYSIELGGNELNYGVLVGFRDNIKKNKKIKVTVKSIDRLPSDIPYFNLNTTAEKSPRERIFSIHTFDKTGLFRVEMSDGGVIIVAFRLFRVSKEYFIQRMYCTDSNTLLNFLKLFREASRRKSKPPRKGIFVISLDQFGNVIYTKKKFPNPPVIHQQACVVEQSIENYFDNKERYLRNGKSGSKRILLFGLPGGGKTTLCYQIARKYEKSHLVVFSGDLGSLAFHSNNCSKFKIPTIVFNEECDKWMGENGFGATDQIKSFLDGYLSSRNTSGEIDFLITNYPEKIERTILFRPGRIHERIEIGCLDPEHAVKVAKFYFTNSKGKLVCDEKELDFFKSGSYTGAQIENIAGMVIDYVNGTDVLITTDVIKKVITQFKDAVNTVKNYKDQPSLVDISPVAVGFMASREQW
jgi:GTPase SAR1 family protein